MNELDELPEEPLPPEELEALPPKRLATPPLDEDEDEEPDLTVVLPALTVWPTEPSRAVTVPSAGATSVVAVSACWAEATWA